MKNTRKTLQIQTHYTATHAALRRRMRRSRPLHRRILLHPASVLLLLCVGVLLGGLTWRGSADSYDVTAIVPASLPSSPAVITAPDDQTHFTAKPITVTGTCPENTYVKLNRNGVFSGVAICGIGQTTWSIATDLDQGSNILLPQVYNITDQPGPASTPITVFYDNPPQPPPPVPNLPPTDLQVTSQDNIPFRRGATIPEVSPYVTIRGTAPPYSRVVVIFHSAALTCATNADGSGNWSCTLDQPLSPGLHTVSVTATTPEGKVLNFPSFQIRVSDSVPPLQKPNSSPPFYITSDFHYQPRISGKAFSLDLGLGGGTGPYALTIQWGDGKTSTIVRNSRSNFSVDHTYVLSKTSQQVYIVKIQAVDSENRTAFLQIVELVHSRDWVPGAPLTSDGSGNTPSLSTLKQWIWFAWPVYGVAALMVFSFWLGERQEYYTLLRRRSIHRHQV